MVDNLYNQTVLDHYKNPRNRGVLEMADFSYEDAGSVCGDEVRIDVRVAEGAHRAIAFSGRGCAVSQASASILTSFVRECPLTSRETDERGVAGGDRHPCRVRLASSARSCPYTFSELDSSDPTTQATSEDQAGPWLDE